MNCGYRLVLKQRKANSTIKQQVRDIGRKFKNTVEVSAQEAVYIVLQLPMSKASQQVVFINTSPPSERVNLIKPLSDRLPIVKTSIYKSTQPVLNTLS